MRYPQGRWSSRPGPWSFLLSPRQPTRAGRPEHAAPGRGGRGRVRRECVGARGGVRGGRRARRHVSGGPRRAAATGICRRRASAVGAGREGRRAGRRGRPRRWPPVRRRPGWSRRCRVAGRQVERPGGDGGLLPGPTGGPRGPRTSGCPRRRRWHGTPDGRSPQRRPSPSGGGPGRCRGGPRSHRGLRALTAGTPECRWRTQRVCHRHVIRCPAVCPCMPHPGPYQPGGTGQRPGRLLLPVGEHHRDHLLSTGHTSGGACHTSWTAAGGSARATTKNLRCSCWSACSISSPSWRP